MLQLLRYFFCSFTHLIRPSFVYTITLFCFQIGVYHWPVMNVYNVMHSLDGEQGDQWKHAQMMIDLTSPNDQVVILSTHLIWHLKGFYNPKCVCVHLALQMIHYITLPFSSTEILKDICCMCA